MICRDLTLIGFFSLAIYLWMRYRLFSLATSSMIYRACYGAADGNPNERRRLGTVTQPPRERVLNFLRFEIVAASFANAGGSFKGVIRSGTTGTRSPSLVSEFTPDEGAYLHQ
jgi:hypothetical protein